MNKHLLHILLAVVFSASAFAQEKEKGAVKHEREITGKVLLMDKNSKPLRLKNVKIFVREDSTQFAYTDSTGFFELDLHAHEGWLIARYPGFDLDSQQFDHDQKEIFFTLYSALELEQVLIIARKYDVEFELFRPIKVETINGAELKKAACCNLAESFESNASVDVVYSDAVSGARAIQMLGLSGIYTQLLSENIPLTRGLSSNFGLSYIPGPWIESIQITKGVGSVVNGYESMTGAINIEYLKPEEHKVDNYFVNLYGNIMGRSEANVHLRKSFNKKVSTLLFGHGSGYLTENDHNHDGFLDNPLGYQVNIFNRWKIQGEKTEQVIGLRVVQDEKMGGQTDIHHPIIGVPYDVKLSSRIGEVFIKNGFLFPKKKFASLGLIGAAKYQENKNIFGIRSYEGVQKSGYFNAIYQNMLFTSFHQIRAGASMIYDDYTEKFNDSGFNRVEQVPGVFAEYTGNPEGEFTFMAGGRADYHNIYGMKYTWRVHTKWNPTPRTSIRLLAGTGFRSARVFMENMAMLASSRKLILDKNLLAEESFNTGASYTFRFLIGDRESAVNVDYYYTQFKNQVLIDLDASAREIHIYNLSNASYSHSAQADIDLQLTRTIQVHAAYKYYFVRSQYLTGWKDKPFIPFNRAMLNVSYTTVNKIWKIDLINNWFGQGRVPSTSENPYAYQMPEKTKSYVISHMQITRLFRKWEVYAGVENLLDFTQHYAIIDSDNPFGTYFDASMIWGPLNGRNIYLGVRYGLKK
jgi:outer membrane receptor for ferrienterochelin and colicins